METLSAGIVRWMGGLGLVAAIAAPAAARTWRVPQDVSTIRAASDSSRAGDDIEVAAGMYAEGAIALRWDVSLTGISGAAATIVEPPEGMSAFQIAGASNASIEGITIRGARAGRGAGIDCQGSVLSLIDCVLEDCRATGTDYETAEGGGIRAERSTLALSGVRITGCSADNTSIGGLGGGILARLSEIQLDVCTLSANAAGIVGNGEGGGLCAIETSVTMSRSFVTGNRSKSGGAGIFAGGAIATVEVTSSLFTENWAQHGPGSALWLYGHVVIDGCSIVDNEGHSALAFFAPSTSIVERSIIAYQRAGVGIACTPLETTSMFCCNTYGNQSGDDACGADLGGNFSQDPLFCDRAAGVYALRAGSPCLPGGHPYGTDCSLIGALALCDTPTTTTSWGSLKSRYR